MPFITDEINHQIQSILGKKTATLTHCPYPAPSDWDSDSDTFDAINHLKSIITAIRAIRTQLQLSPKKLINIIVEASNSPIQDTLFKHQDLLKHLAKIDVITLANTDTTLPACASCMVDDVALHIPLAGLIDIDVECARLTKQIAKLEKGLDSTNKRLNNKSYCDNAPADIVAKERDNAAQQQQALDQMRNQLSQLQNTSTS